MKPSKGTAYLKPITKTSLERCLPRHKTRELLSLGETTCFYKEIYGSSCSHRVLRWAEYSFLPFMATRTYRCTNAVFVVTVCVFAAIFFGSCSAQSINTCSWFVSHCKLQSMGWISYEPQSSIYLKGLKAWKSKGLVPAPDCQLMRFYLL